MFLHRNSQKRIYFPEAIYFITICTKEKFPFFKEEIFCNLFIEDLKICKKLKKFHLYGFVVLYNHIHLLIKPGDQYNISEIMRSLKTNSSRNINNIINRSEGAVTSPRLHGLEFNNANTTQQQNKLKFQWQKSFHDHYIRDDKDFEHHLEYIWYNPENHNLIKNFADYKYSSYNNYEHLIDNFHL